MMLSTSESKTSFPGWLSPAVMFLILFAAVILPALSMTPFSTRGEAREALVAQAMVATGELILPRGYSGFVPSKPPLLHWFVAGSAQIFGVPVGEYVARLPSAVAGLLFLFLFARMVERRAGPTSALWSVLLLAFSVEWFRALVSCRVDMIFSAALASGLLFFFTWHERGSRGMPWMATLLLAAATLAKGPVALVLSGGIVLGFGWLRGTRSLAAGGRFGVALLLAGGVAAIWYVLAYFRGGEEFVGKVLYENVARFTSTMEDRPHKHSVFYLFGTLLLGFMPWTLVFGYGVGRGFFEFLRRLRDNLFQPGGFAAALRKTLQSGLRWGREADALVVFSACVVVSVFVFFAIPEGKRSVYLLPSYPFIAFLLAKTAISANIRWQKFARPLGAFALLVVLVAGFFCSLGSGLIAGCVPETWRGAVLEIQSAFDGQKVLTGLVLALLAGFSVMAVARPRGKLVYKNLVLLLAMFYLFGLSCLQPAVTTPLAAARFAADVGRVTGDTAQLFSFGTEFYGVSFVLGRRISILNPELPDFPVAGSYIVVLEKKIAELTKVVGDRVRLEPVFLSEYPVQSFGDRGGVMRVLVR